MSRPARSRDDHKRQPDRRADHREGATDRHAGESTASRRRVDGRPQGVQRLVALASDDQADPTHRTGGCERRISAARGVAREPHQTPSPGPVPHPGRDPDQPGDGDPLADRRRARADRVGSLDVGGGRRRDPVRCGADSHAPAPARPPRSARRRHRVDPRRLVPSTDLTRRPIVDDAVWVLGENISNPGNVGTLLRSSDAFGVHALVLTARRQIRSTRRPSGPVRERSSTCRSQRSSRSARPPTSCGADPPPVRIIGLDERRHPLDDVDLGGTLAIVAGSETRGLTRRAREACDEIAAIPDARLGLVAQRRRRDIDRAPRGPSTPCLTWCCRCSTRSPPSPVSWTRCPRAYRPIVVDNGSTDGSGDVARGLGATVIDEPAPGFGSACWAGVQAADATVICSWTLTARSIRRPATRRRARCRRDGRSGARSPCRRSRRVAAPCPAREPCPRPRAQAAGRGRVE